jgi:hypothetical protein
MSLVIMVDFLLLLQISNLQLKLDIHGTKVKPGPNLRFQINLFTLITSSLNQRAQLNNSLSMAHMTTAKRKETEIKRMIFKLHLREIQVVML